MSAVQFTILLSVTRAADNTAIMAVARMQHLTETLDRCAFVPN